MVKSRHTGLLLQKQSMPDAGRAGRHDGIAMGRGHGRPPGALFYLPVWLCLSGFALPPETLSCHQRHSVASRDSQLPPETLSCHQRHSVATRDTQLPPETLSCHQRLSVATRDTQLPPETLSCHQRQSVATRDSELPPETLSCHQTLSVATRDSQLPPETRKELSGFALSVYMLLLIPVCRYSIRLMLREIKVSIRW
jgi:hypothetical protein